jgi:hypothetical protein
VVQCLSSSLVYDCSFERVGRAGLWAKLETQEGKPLAPPSNPALHHRTSHEIVGMFTALQWDSHVHCPSAR